DESDRGRAVLVGVAEPLETLSADDDRSGIGPVERADQVEQRALSAAGGSGERDEVAGRQVEGNPGQRADPAVLERLRDGVHDILGAGAQRGVTLCLMTVLAPFALIVNLSVSGKPFESRGKVR